MDQAQDFLAESTALAELIATARAVHGPAVFAAPTAFKSWTVDDVLLHLHFFNVLARDALQAPEAFRVRYAAFADKRRAGLDFPAATRALEPDLAGEALLTAWLSASAHVARAYRDADPKTRVPWAGPDMGARTLMSARLMEVWAHGQAIYDLLGQERQDHDRIKGIAHLGVLAYGWTFQNRGLAVPSPVPHVRLTGPSGAVWEWGMPSDTERIDGDATDFCQVVTQTRNIADTDLLVTGPNAQAWMATAQCFAGPPHDPPAPGTRGTA